jgi:hypothetical protein
MYVNVVAMKVRPLMPSYTLEGWQDAQWRPHVTLLRAQICSLSLSLSLCVCVCVCVCVPLSLCHPLSLWASIVKPQPELKHKCGSAGR